jgi:hypothetical protein
MQDKRGERMSKKNEKQDRKMIDRKKKESTDWPVVVYVWVIGLFLAFWFVGGEAILESKPHPIHWLAGLAGGLLGVPVGWLWYRWRGDVF